MYQVVFPNEPKRTLIFAQKHKAEEYVRCMSRRFLRKDYAPRVVLCEVMDDMPEDYKEERKWEVKMHRVATEAAEMVEQLCMEHLANRPFKVSSDERKALHDCFYTPTVRSRRLYPFYLKLADYIGLRMKSILGSRNIMLGERGHNVENKMFWTALEETEDFQIWRTIWKDDFKQIHTQVLIWVFEEVYKHLDKPNNYYVLSSLENCKNNYISSIEPHGQMYNNVVNCCLLTPSIKGKRVRVKFVNEDTALITGCGETILLPYTYIPDDTRKLKIGNFCQLKVFGIANATGNQQFRRIMYGMSSWMWCIN